MQNYNNLGLHHIVVAGIMSKWVNAGMLYSVFGKATFQKQCFKVLHYLLKNN